MEVLITSVISDLLAALGAEYKDIARHEVAGQLVFSIQVDDARPLIGTHGDTVHALDHLVKKIAEERAAKGASGETPLFLVDVNDYRAKQLRDLEAKARIMAGRARSFRYDVELSPMSAYERLIVHTALSQEPHVKTESQGEGRNRRVVIKYVE